MSLYKDASLVMIPSAYKDGKLYSIRPIPEYGTELVTNGGFDTDTAWTKGTGWTISGGTANCNGTNDTAIEQNISSSNTTLKRITFSVSNYVSGTLRVYSGSGADVFLNVSANGTYELESYLINNKIFIYSLSSFNGSVDNISVKEVINGDGDFTFSRGSNLAATRVDVNGLIEKGRENRSLHSQDATEWSSVSLTNTSATEGDPFSGNNAGEYEVNATSAAYVFESISSSWSSGQVVTGSVYFKDVDQRYVQLTFGTAGFGSSQYQNFDLQTGTKGTGNGIIDSTITSVGNGWYRCSITAQATASSSSSIIPVFVPSSSATRLQSPSVIGRSAQIFGIQIELGLIATDYIETGTSAAQSGILEDMPRLDYSGGASCPSLLLEPQRSNVLAYSEYFSASGVWLPNTITITDNYGTSPEGLDNSTRLVLGNLTASRIAYAPTLTNGTTYTFSCYYKGTAGEKLYMEGNGSGGSGTQTSKLITLTGEWQREDLQFVGGSTSNLIYIVDSRNGSEDTAQDFEVFGAQLETGSYPTSYIPTYGTSQTRSDEFFYNYDDLQDNNILGSTWTFLYDQTYQDIIRDAACAVFLLDNGNSGGDGLTNVRVALNSNGSFRLQDSSGQQYASTGDKILCRYDGSKISWYIDGALLNEHSVSGAFNTLNRHNPSGSNKKTIKLNQVLIFPTALTDSECIALTS